jgi:hypothetical protein
MIQVKLCETFCVRYHDIILFIIGNSCTLVLQSGRLNEHEWFSFFIEFIVSSNEQ